MAVYSIVDEQAFILTTRDTGYRSTAAAISELIDNAVQAGAGRIHVDIWQQGVGPERELFVAVQDDGSGMDGRTLRTALRFGGSTRFNDRTGQGRFGMGLPNSMASQARRLEVYSWVPKRPSLYCYIDIDEIRAGEMTEVPPCVRRVVPMEFRHRCANSKNSGTLVLWSKCDRLDARKATTVARRIERPIAQRFRYFIWGGVKVYINGQEVPAYDPLMLKPGKGAPKATIFGHEIQQEVLNPVTNRSSIVSIKFTELPVHELANLSNEDKAQMGITKGSGISIVRAKREIDNGWFFMGGKRRENYDDWWRCEISFGPELDELFGVTHSKQEINPTDYIKRILTPIVSSGGHAMHARVRAAFKARSANKQSKPATPIGDATLRSGRLERPPIFESGIQETFHISASTIPDDVLYEHRITDTGEHHITLNQNHIFYRALYQKAPRYLQKSIGCFLVALARTDLMAADGRKRYNQLDRARMLSDTVSVLLGE